MKEKKQRAKESTTLKVSYNKKLDIKGTVTAFLFDRAGNLLGLSQVKESKAVFPLSKEQAERGRLYILPVMEDQSDLTPNITTMRRLNAYEIGLRKQGKFVDSVHIPDITVEGWLLCFCLVRGRVVQGGSGLPICNARVHICEVDKIWRWIIRLPDLEIFRLRDDLLKVYDPPLLRRPPWPDPDPGPLALDSLSAADTISINPQPEPPREILSTDGFTAERISVNTDIEDKNIRSISANLAPELRASLNSTSVQVVRRAIVDNVHLILPYLCLWPYWWRLQCDEIAIVETDASGHFETIIPYLCNGDKPDLYFWVEYEIGGIWETVYRPPMACHTYWNYTCGSEVSIDIWDERVPSCDDEPDLAGSIVQILSIGRKVSMSEIFGDGATPANEGLTTSGQPFGGKIEPRLWFSRTSLRDDKHIKYYRWSYRRISQGDGTLLTTPGPWQNLTRTVVRHYTKISGGGTTHEPLLLGPASIGSENNLFEIKPNALPPGGIEWKVVDEREDLASAHFETHKLGSGASACLKALDSAGKYELKLELFKDDGTLVNWTTENIDLQITDVAAPFGTGTVTATTAPDYNRIKNGAGDTMAFRMVLRVDNNCCNAQVNPVAGTGLTAKPCGFIEFIPGATANLSFVAGHPNNFATFSFSVKHGVSHHVYEASANGRTGTVTIPTNNPAPPAHAYTLSPPSTYWESFAVTTLLDGCTRAAFSEALHVWTMATDGYGRLTHLDRFDHDAFALTPEP